MLKKRSGYVNYFDVTKYMSFLVKGGKLLEADMAWRWQFNEKRC